jgi:hypothetical protein
MQLKQKVPEKTVTFKYKKDAGGIVELYVYMGKKRNITILNPNPGG